MTSIDLRTIKLRPGEEHRDAVEIDLVPLELAGQRYLPVPERVPAALRITRATTGTLLQLDFEARLHGPCVRCLTGAALDVPIAATEYQATSPDGDEELVSPYVADDDVDLSGWAHDAVVLALPDKILCRPDCAGLCPVCGRNLNDEPHEHVEETADTRWAALEALRERL